jgi:outer membrane protein insertion porin family
VILAVAVPALSGTALVAGSVAAHAAVASSIIVKGNERIEAATVKDYLTIKPGKSYSAADIDASIKALFDTGLFADVSIVQSGGALVVTVAENPVINAISFDGNKKVKDNILEQIVTAKVRSPLSDARIKTDTDRIKEYYARSGRPEASVTAKVDHLPDNRVNVTFVIVEGNRTGVGSIVFVGNKAFSTSRLTGIIQTRTTNWLSWLDKKDIYSEDKIQADEEQLRKFYLSHGYADFQVLSGNAVLDPAKGRYVLTYTLDEGAKYNFGDITIDSSIKGVDSSSLQRFVVTQKGQVFNADQVQKSVENLTIELSRLGYVFAQVRPRGDRDYSNNLISIAYTVDEGPRAYVERIDIRGNTRTRDYVIRREFDIAEGDAYNRVLVDRAKRRLDNLGYFKSVNITTEPGSAPDKVVLVVTVEDQSTGSFSVSAGLSTTEGLIGSVSMDEKNFLGRGQKLSISVGGSSIQKNYTLSFTDPYFLGTRTSAGLDLYDTTRSTTDYQHYNSETLGGGLRIGLPLSDELSAQFNYKLSGTTISGVSSCSNDPNFGDSPNIVGCFFQDGTRLTSSLGYSVTYSTIDNTTSPTEGWYFKLNQDFAGVGGDARYVKTTGDARVYNPILPGSDWIGMLKVTGGNITGLGQQVATSDNFFLGGETIRGFAPWGFGPRETGTGSNMAVGGKTYVAGTAEVDFPIPFLPPDFGLKGGVFADAGTLFGDDVPADCVYAGAGTCQVSDGAVLRSSVGASIIWASPLGSIRADLAAPLTKAAYDQTQFFRLGAGTQF